MNGYLFLEKLFQSVLSHSKVMQGNAHFVPSHGQELNTDELEQVIADITKRQPKKQYPIAIILPPNSVIDKLNSQSSSWESYRIDMYFLTTTYYTSNNKNKVPNKNTNTSLHRVEQDWEDMKRCAIQFLKALDIVQYNSTEYNPQYRTPVDKVMIDPVSYKGNDRVSGVKLSFSIDILLDCELTDYEDVASLNVNDININYTHNQHLH